MTEHQQVSSPREQRSDASRDPDEFDLVDLWLVLVRRRVVLFATLASCVLIAIAAATTLPEQYRYFTTIEIGRIVRGDQIRLIEPVEDVLVKLRESYIPAETGGSSSAVESTQRRLPIRAAAPDRSNVIVLAGKGTIDQEEDFRRTEGRILDHLVEDHDRLLEVVRKEIALERQKTANQVASLEDGIAIRKARRERLKEKEALLRAQIAKREELIAAARRARAEAVNSANDESRAMAVLMIDNEIQQNQERLDALENELRISLPDERDQLDRQIAEYLRNKSERKAEIEKLELQLASLSGTRAVVAPMRSAEPVGPTKRLLVGLGLAGGLFLGVVLAGFAEFLARARRRQRGSG